MAKRYTAEEQKYIRNVKRRIQDKSPEVEKIVSTTKGGVKSKKKINVKNGIKSLFRKQKVKRASVNLSKTASILGISRGRPKGSYKYSIPISDYKKLQARKKALYNQYREQQLMNLQREGLSPEQINQLQFLRVAQQQQKLSPAPLGVLETPESVMSTVNDNLEFAKFRADKTISPNTQRILRRLRSVQLKSQRDDVEMQRRLKERKMVEAAGSLLATPFIFNRAKIDFTGVSENNILLAPNTFKEREDNRIMKTNRPNILQTREAGNSLMF